MIVNNEHWTGYFDLMGLIEKQGPIASNTYIECIKHVIIITFIW